MPTLIEKVSIVTHAIRTLLATVFVGGVGAAGWYTYQLVDSRDRTARELVRVQQQLVSLEGIVEQQLAEIDRLKTAMRLLKVDHRVALLSVIKQLTDPVSGRVVSSIQFQELGDAGEPLGAAKQFEIPGDIVYIDSWIVKFDDKYIEQSDLDRSTSIVLFHRIFGNNQRPNDGFTLDEIGSRPRIYGRGGRMSDWERQIWGDFWSVANDGERQRELGIRAAHGDAPSIKVQAGMTYRITLRASAGLNVEAPTPNKTARPAA
jgi:hypothetical protein